MSKAGFAAKSLVKYAIFQSRSCPNCGSSATSLLERKHFILELRRCDSCSLQFRFPKDESHENKKYYQQDYQEDTVTDLPAPSEIDRHIRNNFSEVGRDVSVHLKNIQEFLPKGSSLLDYGSSWGYCVYQMKHAGYRASGYEISIPRVEYGKQTLGVDLTSNLAAFPDNSFDGIYAAHVLEHIPTPAASFKELHGLVKPGGYLFIFVPNCGGKDARELGVKWPPMINEKHVLALTPEFFQRNLSPYGFDLLFASSPYDQAARPYSENPYVDGEELLVIARKLSAS